MVSLHWLISERRKVMNTTIQRRILSTLTALPLISLAVLSANSLAAPPPATAERLQTVPNSDTAHPSGLIQGDEWTFVAVPGQRVTIQVDTRDDTGVPSSKLDPVAILKDQNDNVLAFADDNATCSRTPVCGYACPKIASFTIPLTTPLNVRWTIVVRDYNTATTTGTQCIGGGYNLKVTEEAGTLPVTGIIAKTLRLKVNDGAVGDPPGFQETLESAKGSGQ
jgi:hypothetical protein